MHRVFLAVIALVAALACAAVARPATTFVLKGHGWGHGIGLAQYGAKGYADRGESYAWILGHYYPNTVLAERKAKRRVLLASGRSSISLGSNAEFSARGVGRAFAAGTWTVSANGDGRLRLVNGGVVRRLKNNKVFEAGAAPLRLAGVRYRGTITLRLSGSRVSALNTLGLDAYVRGVVPREMPSSWHLEALKSQAVAARSYSLASPGKCSWFGSRALCPTTWDQVYGGMSAETASTNQAVSETKRQVLLSGGSVASTFFFSSSGGRTASVADEWGSNQASYPYLVSVDDPHDVISPHHNWGPNDAEEDCPNAGRDCVWSAGALKQELGGKAPRRIRDFTVTSRNGSNRVATARLSGPPGAKSIKGGTLRAELGLRSTWFTIGVLRLKGAATVKPGKRTTLHAFERHLAGAELQKRVGSGSWQDVRPVQGKMDIVVRPSVTTYYRLHSPSGSTASVRVGVMSQPRFAAAQTALALTGVASPGDAVQLQRQGADGDWVTVAVSLAREDGSWRATFAGAPGTYRAYVASAGDVATSPELTVVSG
jgi:stage II sporulation protein D